MAIESIPIIGKLIGLLTGQTGSTAAAFNLLTGVLSSILPLLILSTNFFFFMIFVFVFILKNLIWLGIAVHFLILLDAFFKKAPNPISIISLFISNTFKLWMIIYDIVTKIINLVFQAIQAVKPI